MSLLKTFVSLALITGCGQTPLELLRGHDHGTEPAELFATIRAQEPFVRIGVRWDGSGDAQPMVRARLGDAAWGNWLAVTTTWQEDLAHNGVAYTGRADRYQIAVAGAGHERPSFLYAEPLAERGDTPRTEGVEQRALGLGPEGMVQSRASWGARPARCQSAHEPQRIFIHHTVTPLEDHLSAAARMRQIQAYHMDVQGWCDIGYHFVVAATGEILQGRPEDLLGTHVAGHNEGSVGISFMGNFQEDRPTDDQLGGARDLVRWLRAHYGIDGPLQGHRDAGQTLCPGDGLYARMATLDDEAVPGDDRAPDRRERGTFLGVIYEEPNTERRIGGAHVEVLETGAVHRTAENGAFVFRLPAGRYTVRVAAPGFLPGRATRDVTAGAEVWGSVGLAPEPEAHPATPPGGEAAGEPSAQPEASGATPPADGEPSGEPGQGFDVEGEEPPSTAHPAAQPKEGEELEPSANDPATQIPEGGAGLQPGRGPGDDGAHGGRGAGQLGCVMGWAGSWFTGPGRRP